MHCWSAANLLVPEVEVTRLPLKVLFALHAKNSVECRRALRVHVYARTQPPGAIPSPPASRWKPLDVVVEQQL